MGSTFNAISQQSFSVQFKDSIEALEESDWVNNDITLKNTSNSIAEIKVSIALPDKWYMLGGEDNSSYYIDAGATMIIPVNIMRKLQALASWQQAKLTIINLRTNETFTGQFFLKSNLLKRFSLIAEE